MYMKTKLLIVSIILFVIIISSSKLYKKNKGFKTLVEQMKANIPSMSNKINDSALYIYNCCNYHYEIIESIIIGHEKIIGKKIKKIFITTKYSMKRFSRKSFENYITMRYPEIKFGYPKYYSDVYTINITMYPKDKKYIKKNVKNKFYIIHEIHKDFLDYKNVFALTPLFPRYIIPSILPFREYKKISNIPKFIIQGGVDRRDISLLYNILNKSKTKNKFQIKILSRIKPPNDILNDKRIIHKKLDKFMDYHDEFTDCYCIIPLISYEKQPHYYSKKCTSSINYAIGYNVKCLMDSRLQSIYKLKKAEVYYNNNNISKKFDQIVNNFYK